MAYELKYYAAATGISSVEWKVELLEKDYSGDSIELLLMGNGIRIGYDREEDRFAPIISRYAEISLKAKNDFQLEDLQFDDERKYQVKIYKNTVLEFVGWLVPFYSSQEFEDISAVVINVMAKDTIKQLSNVTFFNQYPERTSNKQSFKEVISLGLKQLGYLLYLEIYYNKYDAAMLKAAMDCPLSQQFFDIHALQNKDGTWLDFYTIIERLLAHHNLRLFQSKGKWIIVSVIELLDGSVTGRRSEPNYGFYMATVNYESDKTIHTGGIKIKKKAIIRKDIPVQSYTAKFEKGLNGNLLVNGYLLKFTSGLPDNFRKEGNWSVGNVSFIDGGGVQIENTVIQKNPPADPDSEEPYEPFTPMKYLISDPVDISTLKSFRFTADVYGDDDIDEIRIGIRLTASGISPKVYYVSTSGSIYSHTSSIFISKGTEDKAFSFDVKWSTIKADESDLYVDTMEVLLYPGIRYRAGEPVNTKVKFRNLVITGTPQNYDDNYKGRMYVYANTALSSSKKKDPYSVYFHDDVIPDLRLIKLRGRTYVNETNTRTTAWKRTTEDVAYSLVESVLIDKLSVTAKFGDIFEGSLKGYIDFFETPVLQGYDKRFVPLFLEYNLQSDSTEFVLTELYKQDIPFSYKKLDFFNDDKEIDVSDGTSASKIDANENFDAVITSRGGGDVFPVIHSDGGIDSFPEDSNSPEANNKGLLKLGSSLAKKLQLGNLESLTEVIGRLGLKNTNNFLGEFLIGENTEDRAYSFPDRDIEVNQWNDLSDVPESFPPDASYFKTDYGLIGTRNGLNTVFQTSEPFITDTTRVYVNGVRQFKGITADYQELSNQSIELIVAPEADDRLIIDYIKST
ncbi:hypothetical protein [Emticicia sp. BO119]|uniref:hypothetical protein n=1 Tax=Emticicia sp. BO119 TaxID=2757768 RepID=UPI0015F0AA36|nr:hypothetical protein [Emticicia sp. BO119]MBA4851355.1 hypothetical protein [Emticicia sp. BO119]